MDKLFILNYEVVCIGETIPVSMLKFMDLDRVLIARVLHPVQLPHPYSHKFFQLSLFNFCLLYLFSH